VRLRSLRKWAPRRPDLRVFLGYCLAAAVYVAIGVSVTDYLYSFWVALAYVIVAAWAVPMLARRQFGSRLK
jgi:uncharacterized membrane protein YfcA